MCYSICHHHPQTHAIPTPRDPSWHHCPWRFESIRHCLLRKLPHYGIEGPLLQWISSFLNRRPQRVVVDGSHPDWINMDSGVPQGTVLGPLLSLAHINDLPHTILCLPVPTVCRWLPAVSTHPRITGPTHSSELPQEFRILCASLGHAFQCIQMPVSSHPLRQETPAALLYHMWSHSTGGGLCKILNS